MLLFEDVGGFSGPDERFGVGVRGFRRFTERAFGIATSGELVLIHRAILRRQAANGHAGEAMFRYTRVIVTLPSPDPDRRALYHVPRAAAGEVLQGEGCALPRGFAMDIETAQSGEAFVINYPDRPGARPSGTPDRRAGKAQEPKYSRKLWDGGFALVVGVRRTAPSGSV